MKAVVQTLSCAVAPLLLSAGAWSAVANNDSDLALATPSQSGEAGIVLAQAPNAGADPAEKRASQPVTRTSLDSTSQGRQRIKAKLETIRLQEVFYDQLPLLDVLKSLGDEAERRDPEKAGINFMIVNRNDPPPPAFNFSDPGDPLIPPFQPVPPDLRETIVRINLPLKNLRLIDVLDAIVKQCDPPMQYSIEEYAVVFSEKSAAEITQVFSLAKYLEGRSGKWMDDALKDLNELLEITWGLHQQTASSQLRFPPRLHLHRGTQLLIAVGQPEQLTVIGQVIDQLQGLATPMDSRVPPPPSK